MHNSFSLATPVELLTEESTFSDSLSTSGLTMESGEPSSTTYGAAYSAWCAYTPAHSGLTTFSDASSTVSFSRRRLNVWQGSAVNALTHLAGDSGTLSLQVEAGVTYYVRCSTQSTSYSGTHGLTITGQPTVNIRVPDPPAGVKFVPSGSDLVCSWSQGVSTTWEIRIDGGSPISLAASTHTFNGMVVGQTYLVEIRGTNSIGTSDWFGISYRFIQSLVWNDFNRPNSSSVVGSPEVGPAPTVISGVWGISGGSLYSPTAGVLVWETGSNDVDISARYTDSNLTNTGAIYFGQSSRTTADGWRVYFVGTPGAAMGGTSSSVARHIGNTLIECGNWNCEDVFQTGSMCRVVVKDSFIRVFVDGVEVFSSELPEEVRGTRHGFRTTTNAQRWDDLSISTVLDDPAPAPVDSGMLVAGVTQAATTPIAADAFVYRGRDSKFLDTVGGA